MAHSIGHDTDARPEWWLRWSWNPLVLSNLAVVSLVYVRGLQAIWHRAGRGRGVSLSAGDHVWCRDPVAVYRADLTPGQHQW
jgi:hypothetical protein